MAYNKVPPYNRTPSYLKVRPYSPTPSKLDLWQLRTGMSPPPFYWEAMSPKASPLDVERLRQMGLI